MSRNPCVFVVGCPRSGTTLLQRMLDAHPDMTIANDTHFITRAAKHELRLSPTPALTPELVDQVISYRRFYRMGLPEEEARKAAEDCESYSEFVSRLYDLRAKAQDKQLSGEKTPDYCRKIPTLSRLFPQARFVHIVRDGRDTALSTLDWANENKGPGKWDLWNTDPVATCALWWRWQTGTGCKDGSAAGEQYFQVRYEDLLDNVEGALERISSFLGVAYSDRMSNFFQGKTRSTQGRSAKSAWIPPTKGLRDWKTQMKAEDIAVFQAIAGNWLTRTGYELLDVQVTGAAQTRVEKALASWESRP